MLFHPGPKPFLVGSVTLHVYTNYYNKLHQYLLNLLYLLYLRPPLKLSSFMKFFCNNYYLFSECLQPESLVPYCFSHYFISISSSDMTEAPWKKGLYLYCVTSTDLHWAAVYWEYITCQTQVNIWGYREEAFKSTLEKLSIKWRWQICRLMNSGRCNQFYRRRVVKI